MGGVIFTISSSNSIITLGDSSTFEIRVRSDNGLIPNLAAIDFNLNANDPGSTGAVVSGGRFTSGVSNYFPAAAGGFFPLFPTSSAAFSANQAQGLPLDTSQLLATLTLSTAGATAGNYQMLLNGIEVLDSNNGNIPFSFDNAGGIFNYSITAVPEPSSMALLGLTLAGVGVASRLRRRKVQAKKPAESTPLA